MADTATPLLQLTDQENGNNDNTWGDIADENFLRLETAVAGQTAKSITGGAVSLTDDEALSSTLIFTGVLSSTSTITVPTRTKIWLVLDNTTGSYGVTLKTSGGTGYRLPKGRPRWVWCDGANVKSVDAAGSVPIGTILHIGGTALGWEEADFLLANGASLATADYPLLHAKIGYNYGGAGANFSLPNTEGRYLRGKDGTHAVGTYLADELKSHVHTGTTDAGGNHDHGGYTNNGVDDGSHTHQYTRYDDTAAATSGSNSYLRGNRTENTGGAAHKHVIAASGTHTHTFTTAGTGGTETRPATIVALGIVRYQ